MKYLGLICARGGSKGVPGKNIRTIAGKPLIVHAIEMALQVDEIDRVIVSTDSEEIAKVARTTAADLPFMRPPELAADDSSEWLVWRHALRFVMENSGEAYDGLVVVPTVAPLRKVEDLYACIREFEKGEVDVVVTVTEAHRNPYFNMVCEDKDGYCQLVIPPESNVSRRQDAPIVYDMTTVAYVVRPQFVLEANSLFEGLVRSVQIPRERSLDIDTEFDFTLAEYLLDHKKRVQDEKY